MRVDMLVREKRRCWGTLPVQLSVVTRSHTPCLARVTGSLTGRKTTREEVWWLTHPILDLGRQRQRKSTAGLQTAWSIQQVTGQAELYSQDGLQRAKTETKKGGGCTIT